MRFHWAFLLLLATPLSAAAELPADVAEHLARRGLCEHFRGEPWPEGNSPEEHERRAHLVSQIDANCAGLDAAEQGFRRKYVGQPEVIEKLDGKSGAAPAQ